MRIKMKVGLSGSRDGHAWPAVGEEVDLPDEEGAQYCASGLAEPVATDEVEKAVLPKAEERDEDPKPETKRDRVDPARRSPSRWQLFWRPTRSTRLG